VAHKLVEAVEAASMKKRLPKIRIGDTVDVSVRIVEGDKTRTQVFNGTVIARKGSGVNETITVRRIVAGEGIERIFPLHAPSVVGVKTTRKGHTRRAKLYFLRDRVGKRTKLREEQAPKGKKKKAAAAEPQAAETTE
jgi:large subunit ribosomal protein L19